MGRQELFKQGEIRSEYFEKILILVGMWRTKKEGKNPKGETSEKAGVVIYVPEGVQGDQKRQTNLVYTLEYKSMWSIQSM